VGVDTTSFDTYDLRWRVTQADLTVTGGNPPALLGTIGVSGIGGNASGMSVAMFATATGVVLRCDVNSATPPTASNQGGPC